MKTANGRIHRNRSRLATAIASCAGLAAAAFVVAPAGAQQQGAYWHVEAAGIPAAATLTAVAESGSAAANGVVLAVGHLDGAPVIHERVGGTWAARSVTLPDGGAVSGTIVLRDAAVSSDAAVAVGSLDNAPLIVLRSGGSFVACTTGLEGVGALHSVDVAGTTGIVGDENGKVARIADATACPGSVAVVSTVPDGAPAAAVNGLAFAGGSNNGYAVADGPDGDPASRIFRLRNILGDLLTVELAVDQDLSHTDVVSVAAQSTDKAVAIDRGKGYWSTQAGGYWQRSSNQSVTGGQAAFPGGTSLNDIDLTLKSSTYIEAIGGSLTTTATVWHRNSTGLSGQWARDDNLAGAGVGTVNGVVVAGHDDIWAVGSGGAGARVFHYYADPPPVNTGGGGSGGGETGGGSTGGGTGGGGTSGGGGTGSTTSQPTTGGSGTAKKQSSPKIDVDEKPSPSKDEDDAKGDEGKEDSTPKRLMTNVQVVRKSRRMRVRYTLADNARVSILAKRGGRTLGRRKMRTYQKGRHSVPVKLRSRRAPTQLKVTVRPAAETSVIKLERRCVRSAKSTRKRSRSPLGCALMTTKAKRARRSLLRWHRRWRQSVRSKRSKKVRSYRWRKMQRAKKVVARQASPTLNRAHRRYAYWHRRWRQSIRQGLPREERARRWRNMRGTKKNLAKKSSMINKRK